MANADINMEAYRDEINRLARQHGVDPADVHIVDSIKKCCEANGMEEPRDDRAAKTLHFDNPRRSVILLAQTVTREMVGNVTSAIMFNNFELGRRLYQDDQAFVRHLTLHELCHVLHREYDERACIANMTSERAMTGRLTNFAYLTVMMQSNSRQKQPARPVTAVAARLTRA
jgi:hypothetical protein